MAMKLTGASLFIGLLVMVSLIGTCKAAEPWTPDDFDWSLMKVAPQDQWTGLYINLTEVPQPMVHEQALLFAQGRPGQLGEHQVIFVPFLLGLAWQAIQIGVAIGSIATAIQGCDTSDGSQGSIAGCAFGLAGTILSIGSAAKFVNSAGWFARAATTWDQSGLENIALDVFTKRAQIDMQNIHEYMMTTVLRASFGEPEFLGYVPEGHKLSRRNDQHLHPAAPIYRINHPRHGLIDIASREHVNSTRFTISYANHGLKKRQSFQHERLSDHLMEARFDDTAANADPANPQFDAAGGFQQIDDSINCRAQGTWQPGSVLSAQFYDTAAGATFGFASLGIFENSDTDSQLQAFQPTGQPLAVC